MRDLNPRPTACKADALTAAPIAQPFITKHLQMRDGTCLTFSILLFYTSGMKSPNHAQKPAKKNPLWQKTQYSNLIRNVSSGTYYARFRVSGKLIWKSLKTDKISVAHLRLGDLQKAERVMAARRSEVQGGKMTFGDALKIFLQRIHGKPNIKPRTKAYYEERALALKRSWSQLESLDVRQVSKTQCLEWAARFGSESSPVAFNHTVSVVRRTFDIAVETGARYDNPSSSIEYAKERPKRLKLPETHQFEALVKAIENCGWVYGKESTWLVRLLAYGGFRKTEAANVQWADCDFVRGAITVRGDPVTGTKNSEARSVPMISEMRSLLEEIRAQRPDDPATASVIRFKDSRKALAHACKKIGIAKITHHDLRHLFATRCIESGVDIPTVSRWLGHKDGGALAMRVYGHLRDQHSTEMAKRVSFSSPRPAENVVQLPISPPSQGAIG